MAERSTSFLGMTDRPKRAVVYIRGGARLEADSTQCYAHCEKRGYEVVGLIVDPPGRRWGEVRAMVDAHQVQLAVITGIDQLPPDRLPRVEVADPLTFDHAGWGEF